MEYQLEDNHKDGDPRKESVDDESGSTGDEVVEIDRTDGMIDRRSEPASVCSSILICDLKTTFLHRIISLISKYV